MRYKFLISLISSIIILPVLVLAGLYSYYLISINTKINVNEKLEFAIDKGSSVDKISKQLKDLGLIKNPLILKAYLYLNSDKTLQAGYYRINVGSLDLPALVEILQKGSFEVKLTFIEGWRHEEYIDYLREEIGDDFADLFAKSVYIKEGYLFPDTYIISVDYAADNLASWMRNNFDKKSKASNWEVRAFEKGFTLDEVIILASILEREMHIEKDRPIVAGILVKRWQKGWPLQADATVQYVKGNEKDWWPIVTRDDLQNLNSLFNTYQHRELPPSPISNPSESSIEAVLDYKDSPYWFYVSGSDGVTRYSKTLEEHNLNVSQYLK